MPRFRKKPIVIEAEQFRDAAESPKGVCYCAAGGEPQSVCYEDCVHKPHVHTIHKGQAVMLADGDWVIPEPDGIHFYPVKPDIFEATYEPAN